MKKIDKEFILGDSTVNVYGFRLLTSGYMIEEYLKNPIGFLMHKRDDGIVVRWDGLAIKGDKITGKPIINTGTSIGERVYNDVINGFINAASMGQIVALEQSDDTSLKLPGQTGPTVTKWYNRECSLVDIPGNMNAVTLYDKNGELINLADFSKSGTINNNLTHRLNELRSMDWNTLDQTDLLAELKEKDFECFKQKFEGEFGKPYEMSVTNFSRGINLSEPQGDVYSRVREENERRAQLTDEEMELERLQNSQPIIIRKNNGLKIPSIQEQLAVAFKERTINSDELAELKKVYNKHPYELAERLKAFSYKRLKFLNALSWYELDSNDLAEELMKRDFEAFQNKYFDAFQKSYTGKKPENIRYDDKNI